MSVLLHEMVIRVTLNDEGDEETSFDYTTEERPRIAAALGYMEVAKQIILGEAGFFGEPG